MRIVLVDLHCCFCCFCCCCCSAFAGATLAINLICLAICCISHCAYAPCIHLDEVTSVVVVAVAFTIFLPLAITCAVALTMNNVFCIVVLFAGSCQLYATFYVLQLTIIYIEICHYTHCLSMCVCFSCAYITATQHLSMFCSLYICVNCTFIQKIYLSNPLTFVYT